MFDRARPYALLGGRVLLGLIFLVSGVMKVFNWPATAEHMAAEGMPAVQPLLLGAVLVEVGAGLGVILGCGARISALVLFAFLVPTTLIFHDFWTYAGPEQQNQMQHFMKNLTIMGGLLTLAAAGPGRFSLDAGMPWAAWTARTTHEELEEALTR